ncbi:MAG: hypothetical protein IKQ77_04725 [Prevotella sp.]|nr:hypothetical protein [Prevotella sp.]
MKTRHISYLFWILTLLFALPVSAQKMMVESMVHDPFDQTANLSENMYKDNNQEYGGLVKVRLAVSGATFEGWVLKQEPHGAGEYWVFMAKGSGGLTVKAPGYLPLEVDFSNYDDCIVKSLHTYILTITLPGNTKHSSESYLTCPDNNHPHMIDLGLPSGTKWACCNVDDDHSKQSPINYGGYYAWGETEGKDEYTSDTYKYYKNGNYVNLGDDIAGTQYDVAHIQWGGSWVTPSLNQMMELLDKCSSLWTIVNGIEGISFTGKNGGSIFLPAVGLCWDEGTSCDVGSYGSYWSSTQAPSDAREAFILNFSSEYVNSWQNYHYYGLTVRPVSR